MKFLIAFILSIFTFHSASHGQKTAYSKPKVTVNSKSVSTASASNRKTETKAPKIKFTQDFLSFGTIKEDSVVTKTFEFTNTGSADLLITNATGSCGCTIPTFPTTPIAPGEKGSILVKFTAKNKFGPQKPTVTVTTNATPRLVKLQLDGWVDQIPGGVKEWK
jgi:Protein of unknown function (DUF1573)